MDYWSTFRRVVTALVLTSSLWAGREFHARPGEERVGDELLVRLKPGVSADAVLSSLMPGGQAKHLGRLNLHVIKLPAGAPPGISRQLANHPDVEFVEPNRIRHALVAPP